MEKYIISFLIGYLVYIITSKNIQRLIISNTYNVHNIKKINLDLESDISEKEFNNFINHVKSNSIIHNHINRKLNRDKNNIIHNIKIYKENIKKINISNRRLKPTWLMAFTLEDLGFSFGWPGGDTNTSHKSNQIIEKFSISIQPVININAKFSPIIIEGDLDYRNQNIITPIRQQGLCGCCWACAITGVAEAHLGQLLKDNNINKTTEWLSIQQLIDNSLDPDLGAYQGCSGGNIEKWYNFGNSDIIDQLYPGLDILSISREINYPYTQMHCPFPIIDIYRNGHNAGNMCRNHNIIYNSLPIIKITRINRIQPTDLDIYNSLKLYGPIYAVINISMDLALDPSSSFLLNNNNIYYTYGNMNMEYPLKHGLNGQAGHAVVIVGCGTETNEEKDSNIFNNTNKPWKYWIVKNSFGDQWGENGYFRIKRYMENEIDQRYTPLEWVNNSKNLKRTTLSNSIVNTNFQKSCGSLGINTECYFFDVELLQNNQNLNKIYSDTCNLNINKDISWQYNINNRHLLWKCERNTDRVTCLKEEFDDPQYSCNWNN